MASASTAPTTRPPGVPVTNFFHSTLLYNKAMRYNHGLDRDKDGIACEKH
jgi:Excalibur calcium-binding domain